MEGNVRTRRRIFGLLGARDSSNRRIIVGMKSDHCSREMLMRLLQLVATRGDNVLAVHVQQQQSNDTFDANTFHIYEDLCKSKQVEFEVKICSGSCYTTELAHQVRVTFATILALGCSTNCPKSSTIAKFLKALPPTCKLLIIDNGGKIMYQEMGTSQQGSSSRVCRSFFWSLSESSSSDQSVTRSPLRKSLSMPSSSTPLTQSQITESGNVINAENSQRLHDISPTDHQKSALLEAKGYNKQFTLDELNHATDNFCPNMVIGEGAKSKVYRAALGKYQPVAVKVFKDSQYAEEKFFREVEMLSGLKHENIVQIIGYCSCKEICAIVYSVLSSSLKQRLNQLEWSERMQVALGVAKALEYLHSFDPPIIHADVNSSNIFFSKDGIPLLSDFGAAKRHFSTHQSTRHEKAVHVVGTFRYLAPEYIMYGKVDEKIDVYSYGIVLLELITGKEAIATGLESNQESLVLWARSLLTCGLYEELIDPSLNEDYDKDEMKAVMTAAHLCLLHSSSRRPTMKTILRFLEEPNYMLEIQKRNGNILSQKASEDENDF